MLRISKLHKDTYFFDTGKIFPSFFPSKKLIFHYFAKKGLSFREFLYFCLLKPVAICK